VQGETFLCVAHRAWDSLWRNSQPLMWRIAAQNRVLYFDPGRDAERSVWREMVRNTPNLWRLPVREVRENLYVISTPPSLPHARRYLPEPMLKVTMPWVVNTNVRMLARQIDRAMQAFDVKDPILWISSPYDADLVGRFGAKLSCYYNDDEYAQMERNQRVKEYLEALDAELCRRSDVVVATSTAQWKRRRAINPHSYMVPNAADYELFHQAVEPETPLAPQIADLAKPVIGYVGWLGHQIDVKLLLKIAKRYREGALALVGPDEIPPSDTLSQLRAMPNVHWLGRQDPADLPSFLKGFDVALIPYRLAGYVLTAYPLKLHEYLAAGRAIVATGLPELRAFEDVVRIADTHGAFLDNIEHALNDSSSEAVARRTKVASQNTWDDRVAEIYRVLEQRLEMNGRSR
jgi:glycosyltransferase involved in cell wall biosynthesis